MFSCSLHRFRTPYFLKICLAMSSNVRVAPHQQAALQFSAVTVAGQPTDKEKSKIAKVEKKLALDVPEADADAAAVKSDGHKSEEEAAPRKRPAAKHEPSSMKVAAKKAKQAAKKKPAAKKQ